MWPVDTIASQAFKVGDGRFPSNAAQDDESSYRSTSSKKNRENYNVQPPNQMS